MDPYDDLPELLEDVALGEVSERTARKDDGEGLSEAELEAAQARARTIIGEARRGGAGAVSDLREMRRLQLELTLAVGMAVPLTLIRQMIERAGARAEQAGAWMRQLKRVSVVEGVGCISVEFPDRRLGRSNTVYLVLAECGADHDLGAQLGKLYSRIPEACQAEIRKQLSILVHLGRAAYRHAVAAMTPAIVAIAECSAKKNAGGSSLPDAFSTPNTRVNAYNPLILAVDAANTTLYVPRAGPRRVGIYVRLAEEVEPASEKP
jgi:hypothetical protein